MAITKEQVESVIGEIIDVNTENSLLVTKSVKSIDIDGANVSVNIVLGYPAAGYFDELKNLVVEKASAVEGVEKVEVKISCGSAKPETTGRHQEYHRGSLRQGRCG